LWFKSQDRFNNNHLLHNQKMIIKVSQLNYHVGNFSANISKIENEVSSALDNSVDLIVFAELSFCGYPPRDFLTYSEFINRCKTEIDKLAAKFPNIGIILGAPAENTTGKGKPLFNAAFFLYQGKVQHIIKKALLPTYDIFDEYRYFEPANEFEIIDFKGKKIALTICEDLWYAPEEKPFYQVNPMEQLSKFDPDLAINIAASPFAAGHHEKRLQVLGSTVKKYNISLLYVNHVGAQTELIFDGGSLALNADGSLNHQAAFFKEDSFIFNFSGEPKTATSPSRSKFENMEQALCLGIKDYFEKSGFSKAIIGLSGGVDSALTLVLACKALKPENVLAVLLPSQFSSDHSISDSLKLVDNLGCKHHIVSIKEGFETVQETLSPIFKDLPFGLAEENIQARLRGLLLMAISNKFGHILLNTTNKSEAAVGYGTLYGDMCGGLSVIGDVYKTEAYELCRFINRNQEIIPENIITKPPSAELRPNQKDSDSLPDYDILDKILFHYIDCAESPEILKSKFNAELVDKTIKLVNGSEYKRFQMAPVLRVSGKAFGMGRKMPLVAKYWS
jgi:NAD+ synthase (glutamine-hydrolysing)